MVPLWTETCDALKLAIKNRPEPAEKEFENLVFLTVFGKPWVRYHISQAGDGGMKTVKGGFYQDSLNMAIVISPYL